VPPGFDDWTHYLHAADNNPVSRDTVVGPPRRVQWVASPYRSRSHEYTPSLAAMVAAGGRVVCIQDDGVRGVLDERLGDRWSVQARDAFNGLLLWKRPFGGWGGKEWDDPSHWGVPMSLPRRLVATADRVLVTLGYRAPVIELDAETGEVVRVHDTAANAEEIILSEGVLLVRCCREIPDYHPQATPWRVQTSPGKAPRKSGKRRPLGTSPKPAAASTAAERAPAKGDDCIVAIDAESGKALWRWPERRIVTLSLAALNGRVCYHNFEELVCLDLRTGAELWREESRSWPDLVGTAGTLVMYKDLVFLSDDRGVHARKAASGELVWKGKRIIRSAPRQPSEVFVAGGLLWGGLTPQMPTGTIPKELSPFAVEPMSGTAVQGLDPMTGEVRKSLDIGKLISGGHHIRCYRGKATDRFLMWVKRGMEFVDISGGTAHERCDWVRGGCSYGHVPANGLIYSPPHSCICDEGVGINGFYALASGGAAQDEGKEKRGRLEKGPAYDSVSIHPSSLIPHPSKDWPTYRRDVARSGVTTSTVSTNLKTVWTTEVGGRLTPPVLSDDMVFASSIDAHTVYGLSATSGEVKWRFTADARVDSPPTVHRGTLLFGCRDGCVYCLRATDGALVWRFHAAPRVSRIVAHDRLESPWPVHGSVLVVKGTAYFAAGRCSFLDGGIDLFGLDPRSGQVRHHRHLEGPRPDIRTDTGRPYDMDGWEPDILTSDGETIFMYYHEFSLDLTKHHAPKPKSTAGARQGKLHLMATGGFTEDEWHDRTFWMYSRQWQGRYFGTPLPKCGQLLVFDAAVTYALRAFPERNFMSPAFVPGKKGYALVADDNDNEPPPGKPRRSRPPRWNRRIPVRARAMVLAGDTLFLAGQPDVVPEDDPHASFEGRLDVVLWGVSKVDGERLLEMPLGAEPVFDGMIAAGRRLYLSTTAGSVVCLGSGQ